MNIVHWLLKENLAVYNVSSCKVSKSCIASRALSIAAHEGNIAAVNFILSNKEVLKVDSIGAHNLTALFHAATTGKYDVVKLLIREGSHVNFVDHLKRTPLMLVVEAGFTEVAALLLASGASVDNQDIHNATALHRAVNRGHYNITKLLISHKANLHAVDAFGRTIFFIAAEKGFLDITELLIEIGERYKMIFNFANFKPKNQ